MQSKFVRGGLLAAVSVFALAISVAAPVNAQQLAAAAANPDLVAKGVWDAGTAYVVDDIVVARGSTWRAIKNSTGKVPGSTSPNNNKYWQLFARGFNPTGAWSSATEYQPDDLVTRNGSTWRAKKTNTNIAPVAGNTWEQMAASGAAGPAGPNTGIGDGTQSAPSISFTGDADTGIFHPSAGSMALVQNGALMLHTFGVNNAGFGAAALQSNSGTNNTAVGNAAMYPNTSGSHNTAMGSLALGTNMTGANNTAIGSNALANSTTADNTAVGFQALKTQTTGHSNTAIGSNALAANDTGLNNVAIGRRALQNATGANYNIGIGNDALFLVSLGSANVAIGQQALVFNSTGNENVAVGYAALNNVLGASNVGVGAFALSNADGANNTALGHNAGAAISTGQGNIVIGKSAGTSMDAGGHSSILIGNTGTGVTGNTIKIGTQGTQNSAFIAGVFGATVGGTNAAVVVDDAGQLGTIASSRRYKYDIETMADVSAMLAKLRPVTFRYKQAQNDGAHPLQYGLIAEEVADVFPDLTVFNKDGSPETVKYHLLPSFLLAGYQAQQQTIAKQAERDDAQQRTIDAQTAEIAELKQRLAAIEAMLPKVTRAAAR